MQTNVAQHTIMTSASIKLAGEIIQRVLSKVYSCNFADCRGIHQEISISMLSASITALKQQSPFSNARCTYFEDDHQFRLLREESMTSLVIGFQNKLLNNTKTIAKLFRTQCDDQKKTQPHELTAKLVHEQHLTDTDNAKKKCMLQIHNILIRELGYDTLFQFDKTDLSKIFFVNELAVGFPCKPDDRYVKIMFNVGTLNLTDFLLHLGPSLLSTSDTEQTLKRLAPPCSVRKTSKRRKGKEETFHVQNSCMHMLWSILALRHIVLDFCSISNENYNFLIEYGNADYFRKRLFNLTKIDLIAIKQRCCLLDFDLTCLVHIYSAVKGMLQFYPGKFESLLTDDEVDVTLTFIPRAKSWIEYACDAELVSTHGKIDIRPMLQPSYCALKQKYDNQFNTLFSRVRISYNPELNNLYEFNFHHMWSVFEFDENQGCFVTDTIGLDLCDSCSFRNSDIPDNCSDLQLYFADDARHFKCILDDAQCTANIWLPDSTRLRCMRNVHGSLELDIDYCDTDQGTFWECRKMTDTDINFINTIYNSRYDKNQFLSGMGRLKINCAAKRFTCTGRVTAPTFSSQYWFENRAETLCFIGCELIAPHARPFKIKSSDIPSHWKIIHLWHGTILFDTFPDQLTEIVLHACTFHGCITLDCIPSCLKQIKFERFKILEIEHILSFLFDEKLTVQDVAHLNCTFIFHFAFEYFGERKALVKLFERINEDIFRFSSMGPDHGKFIQNFQIELR